MSLDKQLKIKRLEIMRIKVPTQKPYKVSFGAITSSDTILVQLYTNEDIVGVGESDPLFGFTPENPETIITALRDYLMPAIRGMNPLNLEKLHSKMATALEGHYMAKAAVDLAIHDIIGKFIGLPTYDLLGGAYREKLPVMWPLGSAKPEDNVEEAERKLHKGFKTFMIKVGAETTETDVNRVAQIRKAVGKEANLIIDANQGWGTKQAIRTIKKIERYDPAFVEQPVQKNDFEGMARVARACDVPISADESLRTVHDAMKLIEHGSADVFSVKMGKHGGIRNAKKIAALAEAKRIPCFINSMIEHGVTLAASLHYGASTPNIIHCGHSLMSPLRMQSDIIQSRFKVEEGFIHVPTEPGLGVKLDKTKVKKFQVGE